MDFRGENGRFKTKRKRKIGKRADKQSLLDHDYGQTRAGNSQEETDEKKNEGWREGRRIVEFGTLLSSLSACQSCRMGPVSLSERTVCGEMQKGLGGYLYVRCEFTDCGYVNRVPYGKTHHIKEKGMPCFAVNTKLGTAMIDTLGGPQQVNNLLAALNLKTISDANLKIMEARAGEVLVTQSQDISRKAAQEAFNMELNDIAEQESQEAMGNMDGLIEDLGVCPLPDASPSVRLCVEGLDHEDDWSDVDKDTIEASVNHGASWSVNDLSRIQPPSKRSGRTSSPAGNCRIRLVSKFPSKTRSGMSCAVDTAWQKRGFDSLTSHTFFMSKSKYGKKVVKTVVSHRTCSVCSWWRRRRPGKKVRNHHCVKNHTGSARSMESTSGLKGVSEMIEEGTPVEYLEGDGDNTLIAKLRNELNIDMKKRFDKNHVVKNIGKSLYALRSEKGVKLSKTVITHIEKCVKYAFAKNQGDVDGLRENLKALIPHQFGDHSFCKAFFCNFKRKPSDTYVHTSLPYKVPLKDKSLRERLERIFVPITANAEHYVDLGSSQQCEHANKEVSLRAPKSHHFGGSRSLDYRVHAAASDVNEGRLYIPQLIPMLALKLSCVLFGVVCCLFAAYSKMGISPGSVKFYQKGLKRRLERRQKAALPATKRRRLILKQERAINQGAQETLEGASYQSGIGHQADPDVDQLPDAVSRGNFQPVKVSGQPSIITFDLETTDLIRGGVMPHITQIAATNVLSEETFNVYVKPGCPITPEAQRVTGISFWGNNMTVNGQPVETLTLKTALVKFCDWIEKYSNVCLVAHNGRKFDFPILMNTLIETEMKERFTAGVAACVDSMSVFRKVFPGTCLKQESLVNSKLGITYDAHNAMADVESLGKLLQYCKMCNKDILAHSFTPVAVLHTMLFNRQKNRNIRSLDTLVSNAVCKRHTAENIAGSGLNLQHLLTIYARGGEDGLRDVFVNKNCDGQPRVTSNKRILDEVLPKLVEFLSAQK